MMIRISAFLLGTAIGGSIALAQPAGNGPVLPPDGFDMTAIDHSTKPGDDFFQYANGKYLARTAIPADRPIASRRYEMTDRTDRQLKPLLEEAPANAPEQPSDLKGKVGAFYASFMDEAAIERLGAAAIAPELDAIRAASDLPSLARLMGQSTVDTFPAPFGVGIDLDVKKTDAYAIYLGQNGLGLPDRDYYLKPNF